MGGLIFMGIAGAVDHSFIIIHNKSDLLFISSGRNLEEGVLWSRVSLASLHRC